MASTAAAPVAEPSADDESLPPLTLDVAIEQVSTCQRRVRVTIPRDDIDRYRERAIRDLMPTALLPGFRPGRAPKRLVGSRFKAELGDQIRSQLLTDAMTQVSEQHKLAPISEPELDAAAVLLPDAGPMTFEFSIEVRPEFEMPKWKGLSIRRPAREISAADVDEALGGLLRERGRFVPSDAPPAVGDLVVANLRFTAGGKQLSEARELEIVVRPKLSFADAELAGFDALVRKARPGATVKAAVTVSPEAAVEELRGQEAEMELDVLDVKRHELPAITPALLEELGGFESEDALRGAVQKQLENQLEWHRRRWPAP
jgi:trigger factor